MYRKFHNNDELISNVLIAFVLFCMFGIMFYFIYYDTGGWTPSSILYVTFTAISLLYTIFHLVMYLISLREPVLDYLIDLENEYIKLPFKRRLYFKKIKLYANRKNRSEVKIYYRTSILNVILFHLKDDDGNELTYDLSERIGKYAHQIGHRNLYNYNLMILLALFGCNLLFVLVQDRFPVIHQTYKYIIVLGGSIGFALLFIGVHTLVLNRIYKMANLKNNK